MAIPIFFKNSLVTNFKLRSKHDNFTKFEIFNNFFFINLSFTNPQSSKLENFASTKFNRNKKKRNVLFCKKEGLKQHPEANKFSMKILGCHEF